MSRRLYLSLFVILAVVFVPVLVNFGVIGYVVPIILTLPMALKLVFEAKFVLSLVCFGILACCLLGSSLGAQGTFWLSSRCGSRGGRVTLQVIFLSAVFACSFLRVLTYDSLRGSGGIYNFWEAVERYVEKRTVQAE